MFRDYLDYNATSPLSQSVVDYLGKGDLPFANPASIHSSGKKAKALLRESSEAILKQLQLPNFHLIYHSGATEAINTFFSQLSEEDMLIYSAVDHPCVVECAKRIEQQGVGVYEFSVDQQGQFDCEALIKKIKVFSEHKKNIWLNFTVANNETGVFWPLELAEKIKSATGCLVHVDAVQLVGKVPGWQNLSHGLDAYSFSAHKFGALKSFGFSLVKDDSLYPPLIIGGGQQQGLRAGTENVLGAKLAQLALLEAASWPLDELADMRDEIEDLFTRIIADQGEVVALNAKHHRLVNTTLLLFKKHRADFMLAAFDLAGLDVSMGSACSSQALKESRILTNMGHAYNRNGIRISLGVANLSRRTQILERVEKVFNKLA